jgi:hypothetical protein
VIRDRDSREDLLKEDLRADTRQPPAHPVERTVRSLRRERKRGFQRGSRREKPSMADVLEGFLWPPVGGCGGEVSGEVSLSMAGRLE